ncbi:MAG: helix-turn-helix transcriptional regulator [Gemmatimonadaceae bacterium]
MNRDDETSYSAEDDAQTEYQRDRVEFLVGRYLLQQPDSPGWHDEHFLEWLARRTDPAEDELSDEEALAYGRRMMNQCLVAAVPVRRIDHPVPERPASIRTNSVAAMGFAFREHAAPKLDLQVAAGPGRELWEEVCESWVDLPPEITPGRYLALKIVGQSMAPLMHSGDVILVQVGRKIVPGSVVVARDPESGYVCKRISRIGPTTIDLSSLNPEFPGVTIPRDDSGGGGGGVVLGTVILRWCSHGDD